MLSCRNTVFVFRIISILILGVEEASSSLRTGLSIKQTQNTKHKRKWDRKNACFFCGEFKAKIPRHLEERHSCETEVAKFMAIPKGSEERRLILKELTNKGNFAYNIAVLEKGNGELLPTKRPSKQQCVKPDQYSPCEFCLGFYIKRDLWKHQKNCQQHQNRWNCKSWCEIQKCCVLTITSYQ